MAENRTAPGPVRDERIVEEPAGFDHPPTDRIPAMGDLPRDGSVADRQDDKHDKPDEPVAETVEVETIEPVETVEEPATPTGSAELPAATGFFDEGAVSRFRDRWRELQADFVDDPSRALQSADELVDEAIRELSERKRGLGGRWRDSGDTEELRVAMHEYRSFFDQLLNA
ncbi:hypothetical protein [Actinophytocola sp.]|uniref:hypothetical protein n=1 Tax=Actinophytocola sp. TaxID=1872138 RepID=UPI002ED1BFB4